MKQTAWTSTVDLATLQTMRPTTSMQEQARESSTNFVGPPSLDRFNDCPIVGSMIRGAAVCDRVAASFNDALARLDRDDGDDDAGDTARATAVVATPMLELHKSSSLVDFRKTWLYSNSRLPPHMPPMKIYMATWQIICAAAQASKDVYRRPRIDEMKEYVRADWRQGTKAMVIKSRPVSTVR